MPDTKQQLGIELNVSLNEGFKKIIDDIQKAFASINVDAAVKQIKAVEEATKKAEKTSLDFSKLTNAQFKLVEQGAAKYNAVLKETSGAITKTALNHGELNKVITQSSSTITNYSGNLVKLGSQFVTFQQQQSAFAAAQRMNEAHRKAALKEEAALYTKHDAMLSTRRKYEEEIGDTTLKMLRRTAASKKTDSEEEARLNVKHDAMLDARRKGEERLGTDTVKILQRTEKAKQSEVAEEARLNAKHDAMLASRRKYEEELGAGTIKVLQRTAAARKAEAAEEARLNAKHDAMLIAKRRHEEEAGAATVKVLDRTARAKQAAQQAAWNGQVGTAGVEYKPNPYGDGFVRASVDTKYVDRLRQANAAHDEFVKSSHRATGAGTLFGESLGKVTKHLVEFYAIRGILFAISNQVRTAVSELLQFNQALADTAGISNASEAGIKRFGLSAESIARNSKMDLQETMKLMNLLAQSGVSEKDVPLVSKVTAMFATGTGSSAENSVRVMTTALNVWEIEAKNSAIVANTLAAGLNSAKLEVNELSTVFNYLAPMAKQAGYSIQETTAIIATMSQMGVKASTIGTGTGQLLTRLMAPTKGVKDLAKAYNLELDQLNPRLHKFSEIIKTLQTADGGKAIPVQDLLKGFGQIAGRSVSAAVTAGAEYFKEMERNVSLGNASLVAYSKVMEGVGAKMNILRQTFVQLIGSITEFNGIIGVGYQALLNITRGLMTTEGKVLAVASALLAVGTAVYTCRAALIAFTASNPLTIWLSLAGIALTALIAKFGSLSPETEKANREFRKLTKDMSDTQRAFQVITDMYGKATQAGELNNTITREHREELEKLVRTTPSLHGVIDTSVTKYGQLAESIKKANDQMEKMSDMNLSKYNSTIGALNRAKAKKTWGGLGNSYDEDMAEYAQQEREALASLKKRGYPLRSGDKVLNQETIQEIFNKKREDRKAQFSADPNNRDNMDRASTALAAGSGWEPTDPNATYDIYDLNFSTMKKGKPYEMPKSDTKKTPTPGIGDRFNNNGPTGIDQDEAARRFRNDNAKLLQQKLLKSLETELATAMEDIKGETDPALYEEKKKAIQEQIRNLTVKTLKAFKEEQNIKQATYIGAEYDPSKPDPFVFPKTEEGKLNKKKYEDLIKRDPTAYTRSIDPVVDAQGYLASDGSDLRNAKIPDLKKKKEKEELYTSDKDVKAADKLLANTTKRLELEKDLAKTSSEVREAELGILDAQIANTESKAKAYQTEIETLEAAMVKTDIDKEVLDKQLNRYILITESLEEIKELEETIRRKRKEEAETGPVANFKKGASQGLIGMGDVKSNSEELGLGVVNTGLNGMVDLLDQSISKLSKLEWSWKSFRQTLGEVMQDIAGQLQKYYIKLMVIWAAEQLVGLFGSSAGSGGGSAMSSSTSTGTYTLGANGLSAPKFAGGGRVVGGTPGIDSVPIMAMPDEYVVKADVVRSLGVTFMDDLNMGKIRKMATGGLVGGSSNSSGNPSGGGLAGTIQIVNVVNPDDIPQTTDAQIINVINLDIIKRGSTLKTIKMALG